MKITNEEYAKLIRDSEKLELLKEVLTRGIYVSGDVIRTILGIEEDKEKEE